jgi:hypothetical protein
MKRGFLLIVILFAKTRNSIAKLKNDCQKPRRVINVLYEEIIRYGRRRWVGKHLCKWLNCFPCSASGTQDMIYQKRVTVGITMASFLFLSNHTSLHVERQIFQDLRMIPFKASDWIFICF